MSCISFDYVASESTSTSRAIEFHPVFDASQIEPPTFTMPPEISKGGGPRTRSHLNVIVISLIEWARTQPLEENVRDGVLDALFEIGGMLETEWTVIDATILRLRIAKDKSRSDGALSLIQDAEKMLCTWQSGDTREEMRLIRPRSPQARFDHEATLNDQQATFNWEVLDAQGKSVGWFAQKDEADAEAVNSKGTVKRWRFIDEEVVNEGGDQ